MSRIGIDVGGTFTDIVLQGANGRITSTKVPSTPDQPARGILAGIRKALGLHGASASDLRDIVHGTTVATNAVLERTGARTALIATRGFRDSLEIRRLRRPPALLYDLTIPLAEPLVPRHLRLEVAERVDRAGTVVRPLDRGEVRRLGEALVEAGVESVAVSLLFAFANATHERAVADELRRLHPSLNVSLSSDVLPEMGEYERTTATVMNAYVAPVMRRYLRDLEEQITDEGLTCPLYLMQSNGGLASINTSVERPVTLLLSGPAGGVTASCALSRAIGVPNLLTMDMGGTSFDACLVLDGQAATSVEREFLDQPVRVPMVDIHTIGTGGGSIAWVDDVGGFRLGPRSAGAVPGPACYGRGGQGATVTDADLVLGYLDPDTALAGEVSLDIEAARAACARLGTRLGLSTEDVALGIFRIGTAAMAGALRVVSLRQGVDPRELPVVSFGGAGSVHATAIARELGSPRVIVPPLPGCYSAFGMLVAHVRHDYVRSYVTPLDGLDARRAEAAFAELTDAGIRALSSAEVPNDRWRLEYAADLRYLGQNFALTVPLSGPAELSDEARGAVGERFRSLHASVHGFAADAREPLELVSLRLRAVGLRDPATWALPTVGAEAPRPRGTRRAYFEEVGGWTECAVYDRSSLRPGDAVPGGAIVEQPDTTIVVPPRWTATADGLGNLVLEGAS